MKFILNCTDDWATMPKMKIIIKTAIWFVLLTVASIVAILICQMAYMSQGIDPTQLTKFGGDVTTRMDKPVWQTVLLLLVIAPIAEEIIFRLGVSLKRQAVALWSGLLPVTIAAYFYDAYANWIIMVATIVTGAYEYANRELQWTNDMSQKLKSF